jgi:hypothetical protein
MMGRMPDTQRDEANSDALDIYMRGLSGLGDYSPGQQAFLCRSCPKQFQKTPAPDPGYPAEPFLFPPQVSELLQVLRFLFSPQQKELNYPISATR